MENNIQQVEKGTLYIRIKKADIVHDDAIITQMSPYFIISLGNQQLKGEYAWGQGTTPQWQDHVYLFYIQGPQDLHFYIKLLHHKKYFGKDTVLARGGMLIQESILESKMKKVELFLQNSKKQQDAILFIDFQYIPFSQSYKCQFINENSILHSYQNQYSVMKKQQEIQYKKYNENISLFKDKQIQILKQQQQEKQKEDEQQQQLNIQSEKQTQQNQNMQHEQ